MRSRRDVLLGSILAGAMGLGCGASPTGPLPPSGQGQLSVLLVDAPTPVADEIWVTVTQVRVHVAGGGWQVIPVAAGTGRVDLLKLQKSALPLGFANLPPGTVTQVRLLVEKDGNEVKVGRQYLPLKVPSGFESGIKIHGPWKVSACNRTTVTLDFDGKKSIWLHPTGAGDEWVLRPVIRVRKTDQDAVGCDGDGSGPGSGIGAPCGASSPACTEGLVCVQGTCKGGVGTACQQGADCFSGVCEAGGHCGPSGTGGFCGGPADCLSGDCASGACLASGPAEPCRSGADCASGSCGSEGSCDPGSAGGTGQTCSSSVSCLSNDCTAGSCEPGNQGSICSTPADCQAGMTCLQGNCEPMP